MMRGQKPSVDAGQCSQHRALQADWESPLAAEEAAFVQENGNWIAVEGCSAAFVVDLPIRS